MYLRGFSSLLLAVRAMAPYMLSVLRVVLILDHYLEIDPKFLGLDLSLWRPGVRFVMSSILPHQQQFSLWIGLFFLEAMLAWFLGTFSILNMNDKRRKSAVIVVFVAIATLLLIMLATIFAGSVAFSLSLGETRISEGLRGEIACFIDQSGTCTKCDADEAGGRCPEWSIDDVTRILQTQAKTGAAFAAIFAVYAYGILRYGITLRKHISNYQIDFV